MLEKLVIPMDDVLNVVFGQKLDRGGYIEVAVPAIKMTKNVHYTYTYEGHDKPDGELDKIVVSEDNCATIPKYCGKKIIFIDAPTEDKDLYSKEHITYITKEILGKGKSAKVIEKPHELTFYWRLVKKTAKK